MKTKRLFLLFAIVAYVGTMHAGVVNGTCGENLTWTLNTKDSTLTIEGSGAMDDWTLAWASHDTPWYSYISYIANVSLQDGITHIGACAFIDCSALRQVAIPNSVTSIGPEAFNACSSITSITIPDNVTSINRRAFGNCYSLTSVRIGTGVTSIEDDAFFYCSSLTTVVIPNNVTSIGESAFRSCSALKSITIGSGVTSIGDVAFQECNSLKSVVIPDNVTTIGSNVFSACESLVSVEIGTGMTSMGTNCFSDCPLNRLVVKAVVPPVTSDGGIDQNACKLYVPAESIEAYQNAVWWEDFLHILPIGSSFDRYRVEFQDWDGTLLKVDSVEHGYAASAPDTPTRAGYSFTNWDKDFDNITSDLVVTAQYELGENTEFAVVFSNGNDGVVGFYRYNAANLNSHKAFVVFSGSNQAPRRMPFIFDQATGVENVQGDKVQSTKVLRDGQLIIIRNGVEYNANGMIVK